MGSPAPDQTGDQPRDGKQAAAELNNTINSTPTQTDTADSGDGETPDDDTDSTDNTADQPAAGDQDDAPADSGAE